jgi:DNA-binding MarR family transcriptional regulator
MKNSNASLRLDDQLCFALYAATNAITRTYRGPLAEIGLTYPQYLVMLVLWEHGTQSVKGLADRLDLDSSTLTPLLKRLAAGGLITRLRDADDERIVRIGLTAQGSALQEPASHIQARVACRTRLSEDRFVALRGELHQLVAAMAQPEDEPACA